MKPIVKYNRGLKRVHLIIGISAALALTASAAESVLTRSYDDARRGRPTSETILPPATVASGLRLLYTLNITDDRRIEAQPLFVPGLKMSDGLVHDVIYVFSMSNSIWAFDANTGAS